MIAYGNSASTPARTYACTCDPNPGVRYTADELQRQPSLLEDMVHEDDAAAVRNDRKRHTLGRRTHICWVLGGER